MIFANLYILCDGTKVTRILLVVVFANLGSAVGTFVALSLMVRVIGA